MKTISISDLKARLSAAIRAVRRGRPLVITDRGRPVARLEPIRPAPEDLHELVEAGLVRTGRRSLPKGLLDRARPPDPEGAVRQAIADERDAGL